MEIREFSGNMKKALEKKLGDGYTVEEKTISKNNGVSLEALVIRKDKINLSPTIYLRSYYERYTGGEGLKSVSESLLSDYYNAVPPQGIDMDFYTDYEKVRKGLFYKLISTERNSALLEEIPHIPFQDLDIVFYYSLDTEGMPEGTILVRNKHMEMWGIGTEELMKDATANSPLSMPAKCSRLLDVIKEMKPESAEFISDYDNLPPMYIISNEKMINGASAILYPGLLSELSDKLGSGLLIIPSSVHEVIVIPENGIDDRDYLRKMIYCINRSQLDPQDILSDTLYYFDAETEKITVAS